MGSDYSWGRSAPIDVLIAAAKSAPHDDTPAMNEIVRRFDRLANIIARGLTRDLDLREDLSNAALHAVVKAVRAHDGRTTGFASYVTKYMRGESIRAIRRLASTELPLSDDHPIWLASGGSVAEPEHGFDELIAMLDEPQRALVVARYVGDQKLREIARDAGTSVSAVSQRLSSAHRRIARSIVTSAVMRLNLTRVVGICTWCCR